MNEMLGLWFASKAMAELRRESRRSAAQHHPLPAPRPLLDRIMDALHARRGEAQRALPASEQDCCCES